MFDRSLRQPGAVRAFVIGNILFSGFSVPIHVALTIVCGFLVPLDKRKISPSIWFVWIITISYGLIAYSVGPCVDGIEKVFVSAAAMSLLIILIEWLSRDVRFDRPLISIREALALLHIIIFFSVAEYGFYLLNGLDSQGIRFGGLYLEPSHLALSVVPLLIYVMFFGNSIERIYVILLAFVLAAISYSSTLIILMVLISFPMLIKVASNVRLNRVLLLTLFCYCLAVTGYVLFANHDEMLLRINDLLDLRPQSNLSSLVFANGWQLLQINLENSDGFGLGFNAMGCNPRAYTEISEWLAMIDREDQNYNDGSFLFSKFGSEFGYLGVLLFISITLISLRHLISSLSTSSSMVFVLSAEWLAVIAIGGFVRSGGGYFSGPFMLAIFSLFLMIRFSEMSKTCRNSCELSRSMIRK